MAEALTCDASLDYLLRAAQRDFIQALPWATVGTVLWILIAYKFHQSMIDAVTGGARGDARRRSRGSTICWKISASRAASPCRSCKVMEDDALNAFATGMNEKQYSITVTTGLLDALDDAELEAVLGHELTHIRNGDVRMLVIAVIIAGAISFFAELLLPPVVPGRLRLARRGASATATERRGGAVIAIVIAVALVVVAWLLSIVIRFALSRSREFLADAGSVELTKNPDAMISALRKIEGRGELEGATSAVMEMCVDNPREGFADLFATHPSIEKRIEALIKFAGGHDPGPLQLAPPEQQGGEPEPGGPWGAAESPGGAWVRRNRRATRRVVLGASRKHKTIKQAAAAPRRSCRSARRSNSAATPAAVTHPAATCRDLGDRSARIKATDHSFAPSS